MDLWRTKLQANVQISGFHWVFFFFVIIIIIFFFILKIVKELEMEL
jgi:hypothetical protein